MKNDIGYFYDTEEVIDLKNFTELFIVMLAKKEKPFYYEKKSKKTAEIPTNYKQSIELVMHAENSWPINFSKLINIHDYYENQSEWECNISKELKKYLKENKKDIAYDFEFDTILITFTNEEIKECLNKYDEKTINTMDHFTNIIQDAVENRIFDLRNKEAKRVTNREYIKTGNFTFSQTWKN